MNILGGFVSGLKAGIVLNACLHSRCAETASLGPGSARAAEPVSVPGAAPAAGRRFCCLWGGAASSPSASKVSRGRI